MDKKYWRIVLISPIVLIYSYFILGGIYNVLIESLGYIPSFGLNDVTLKYYLEAFHLRGFSISIFYSLYLSFISASISVSMGVLLSYFLVKSKSKYLKRIIKRMVQLGIVLPYLYVVFIVVLSLSKTGIYSRILYNIGIIDDLSSFPQLLYKANGLGIILVFALKGIPFVTLITLSVMSSISDKYSNVSSTLGCNSLQTLRRVYLPLCSDVIVWSGMVLFSYDMGSFEVPYILGSLKPKSYSVRLFSSYINPNIDKIPSSMAMTIILFAFGLCFVTLFALLLRRILGGRTR